MTQAVMRSLASNIHFDVPRPDVVGRNEYDVLVASAGCLQGGPSRVFYEKKDWGN